MPNDRRPAIAEGTYFITQITYQVSTAWQFSSVHRLIAQGLYPPNWGGHPIHFDLDASRYESWWCVCLTATHPTRSAIALIPISDNRGAGKQFGLALDFYGSKKIQLRNGWNVDFFATNPEVPTPVQVPDLSNDWIYKII